LTGGTNAHVTPEATQRFMANEYAAADVVKFTDVAAAKIPSQSLYDATDDQPAASARWRDVLEPMGWGDELRVALRDRAGVWGFLCLHRCDDESAFSPADRAAITALVPQLAEAFRRTAIAGAPSAAGPDPGVILLREDLSIEATTGSAGELLDELSASSPAYPLPLPVASLAARLLRELAPQRLTMQAPSGRWISLHAGLLDGAGAARVAIVVESPTPAVIMPVFASVVGLTPRESEVAAALLRGRSTRLTARDLHVTEQTLQTQLRSVFAKAGVHSRAELVARLLGGH
jgi:DNA-binding CsgD family transcriptional regulator